MSETIKAGDTISVNYTGRFEDGNVFDSSEGREPLKFTVGTGQLIKGFDDAVVGMVEGESKQVTVVPEKGYGAHSQELLFTIPRDRIPEHIDLQMGMPLTLTDSAGNQIPATVKTITEEAVTMDANHPLAGQTLVFDIEIVETGLDPDPGCSPAGGCSGGCSC